LRGFDYQQLARDERNAVPHCSTSWWPTGCRSDVIALDALLADPIEIAIRLMG
jgi:hypothetical protein